MRNVARGAILTLSFALAACGGRIVPPSTASDAWSFFAVSCSACACSVARYAK